MLLEGDSATGYHLQIPRQKVGPARRDPGRPGPARSCPSWATPPALYRLLAKGGPGREGHQRDAKGPVKMRYQGQDDRDKEVTVWLERTRWELGTP